MKLTDPLVPIDGARVAVALAERGLNLHEVARRVQKRETCLQLVNESRIRSITTGRTKERCRRSLLVALAAVLDQPIWFLSGGNLGWRQLGVSLDTTPRAYLAARKLVGAVARRADREPRMADDDAARFVDKLLDLLDPRTWRENLFRPRPSRPLQQRRDVRPAEMEVAVPALAEALRVILAPWLRGDAVTLELDALRLLLPRRARQPVRSLPASAVLVPEEFEIAAVNPLNREGLSAAELARLKAREAKAAAWTPRRKAKPR